MTIDKLEFVIPSAAGLSPAAFLKLVNELKRDEQFRALPYRDTQGKLTICYGVNIQNGGFAEPEGNAVLNLRVWSVYAQLVQTIPWMRSLDDARQAVLINMAYNLGIVGELGFHVTLGDIRRGNFYAASLDMLKSTWAGQVGDRARRLSKQMETGVWA